MMTPLNELISDGLRFQLIGQEKLRVTPADRITDYHRSLIKRHKPAIIQELRGRSENEDTVRACSDQKRKHNE